MCEYALHRRRPARIEIHEKKNKKTTRKEVKKMSKENKNNLNEQKKCA